MFLAQLVTRDRLDIMKRLRFLILTFFIATMLAHLDADAGENIFRQFGKDAKNAGKQAGKAGKQVGKDIGQAGKKVGKGVAEETRKLFRD